MSTWLWVLWIASVFVILGVVLEEAEHLSKACFLLKLGGLRTLLSEFKSKSLLRHATYIGFATLVIGLAVELFAQAKVEVASNRELGLANTNAAAANTRAAKIEAAAAPRDVPPLPRDVSQYADWVGSVGIVLASYVYDPESERLAAEIVGDLEGVRFEVADSSATLLASPPLVVGITVSGPDEKLVTALIAWLNINHLDARKGSPPESGGMTLPGGHSLTHSTMRATIFVGSKPLPGAFP